MSEVSLLIIYNQAIRLVFYAPKTPHRLRYTLFKDKEVVGETLWENQASIKLLEKAGFKKSATGFRGVFNQDTSDISGIAGLQIYELVA